MYSQGNQGRAAYLDASVATASPARLLVMLLDRLVRDVRAAADAQGEDDHPAAHSHLLHAQEIVLELRSSLRTDVWEGGAALDALYEYLYSRLVHANVRRDAAATEECLGLATQLCETWREAAQAAAVAS